MRTVLASLLLPPLAVIVLVASVLTGAATLLSGDGLVTALRRADAGTRAQRALVAEVRRADLSAVTKRVPILDREDVPGLIRAAVPATQLQDWFESAAQQAAVWLDGSDPVLHLTLDLGEEKHRIGEALNAYLNSRVGSVPVCTPADAAAAASGTLRLCRRAGESDAALLGRVSASTRWQATLASVPDRLDVANLSPAATTVLGTPTPVRPLAASPELLRLRDIYQRRTAALAALWALAALLAALVVLLNRRPGLRLLRWVGVLLVGVSVLPSLIGLAGQVGLAYIGAGQLNLPPRLSPEAQDAVVALLKAAAGVLLRAPLVIGLAAFVLGVVALVLSFVHPHAGSERHPA